MPATSRVTIVSDDPALIAYREEASTEWKTPLSPGAGRFEIDVAGPYRVLLVCTGASGDVFAVQFAQTLDDDRTIEQTCGSSEPPPYHVRGQVLQSGDVSFGAFGRGESAPPWSFDLPARAGTFDFVAFSGDFSTGFDHVEIRRDIAITGDLELGTIDATQDPTEALIPTQFTASNLAPGEFLSSFLLLQSGNTSAILQRFVHPDAAWQVNLVPAAALRATDTQGVQLSASSSSDDLTQQRRRSITRRIRDGGSTSVTLMDLLGPTTFAATADRLAASWASLSESDAIGLSRTSFSDDFSRFVEHDLVLSPAFLAATGASVATLDFTDVPGFRPEWRHDPTLNQGFDLTAFRGTLPDDMIFSDVSETHPAPTPPGSEAPRAARAARFFRGPSICASKSCGPLRSAVARRLSARPS
ncbi:MAG TPA: hypothetical protein VHW23_29725 [Kofleriaceae bacterium]|nr:hypothetical protein [Kofleriaceae bacterium]